MNYTQLLRGLNCIKWLAIVLAALYALIVVVAASNGVFTAIRHHHVSSSQADFVPIPALFALCGFVASGIASALARALSSENEGHAPVVWTFPVSRVRYAISVFLSDALFSWAAFALTFVWLFALLLTFRVLHLLTITPDWAAQLLRYLMMPIGLYGLITAVTASTGKAGRALSGWTWCALILIGILGAVNKFPPPWHGIFMTLNVVNPLAYVSYHYSFDGGDINVAAGAAMPWFFTLGALTDAAALAAIGVVGLVAGTAEWQRLEA